MRQGRRQQQHLHQPHDPRLEESSAFGWPTDPELNDLVACLRTHREQVLLEMAIPRHEASCTQDSAAFELVGRVVAVLSYLEGGRVSAVHRKGQIEPLDRLVASGRVTVEVGQDIRGREIAQQYHEQSLLGDAAGRQEKGQLLDQVVAEKKLQRLPLQ